jgi:hypothetical protein
MNLFADVRTSNLTDFGERRDAPRRVLEINAKLRGSGSHAFSVVVTDLSLTGFGCDAVSGLHAGDICWLTLPGLSGLQAEVMWNNGSRIGCEFSSLLSRAVHDHVMKRWG